MNKPKKDAISIPKGSPPTSVVKFEEEKSKLLDDSDSNNSDAINSSAVTDYILPYREFAPTDIKSEQVVFENETLKFTFKVLDWCFTDLALIFVLNPDQFNVEPKKDSNFVLTFRDISYPVIYIGGPIYFKNYNLHQIIFIRNLAEENNNQN